MSDFVDNQYYLYLRPSCSPYPSIPSNHGPFAIQRIYAVFDFPVKGLIPPCRKISDPSITRRWSIGRRRPITRIFSIWKKNWINRHNRTRRRHIHDTIQFFNIRKSPRPTSQAQRTTITNRYGPGRFSRGSRVLPERPALRFCQTKLDVLSKIVSLPRSVKI